MGLVQWFPKWDPRPPGNLRAEFRGSAIVQLNIGCACNFKKKNQKVIEFSLRIKIGAYYFFVLKLRKIGSFVYYVLENFPRVRKYF